MRTSDPVLTATAVADLLGIPVRLVRQLARNGVIPAYRLAGRARYRFVRDEVEEWAQENAVMVAGYRSPTDRSWLRRCAWAGRLRPGRKWLDGSFGPPSESPPERIKELHAD